MPEQQPRRGLTRRHALQAALAAVVTSACGAAVRRHTAAPSTPTTARPSGATPTPSRTTAAPAAPTTSAAARPTAPRGPATEIVTGPRTTDAVALTFHGAGDAQIARDVLAVLQRYHAKVTILGVGTWLLAQPDVARRYRGDGHEVGNHTLHHLAMRHLGPTQAYDEIARCRDVLEKIFGTADPWFRPSGTPHANRTILEAAGRAGYAHCISYDVDSLDYQDPGPDAVVRNVLGQVQHGSIVSMHLGHRGTVLALPRVLAGLQGKGLRPVTLSTLLA